MGVLFSPLVYRCIRGLRFWSRVFLYLIVVVVTTVVTLFLGIGAGVVDSIAGSFCCCVGSVVLRPDRYV